MADETTGTEIFTQVIAQLLRTAFRMLAGWLVIHGVTQPLADQALNIAVSFLAPLCILFVTEGIAFLRKRYFNNLVEAAYLANPAQTSLSQVKTSVARKNSPPIEN